MIGIVKTKRRRIKKHGVKASPSTFLLLTLTLSDCKNAPGGHAATAGARHLFSGLKVTVRRSGFSAAGPLIYPRRKLPGVTPSALRKAAVKALALS